MRQPRPVLPVWRRRVLEGEKDADGASYEDGLGLGAFM